MQIKTSSKLYCQGRVYRLVSSKPKLVPERPGHDRYFAVPELEFPTQVHSYIRAIDVPRSQYMVELLEEIVINVQESSTYTEAMGTPPEPKFTAVEMWGEFIPEEELLMVPVDLDGGDVNVDL